MYKLRIGTTGCLLDTWLLKMGPISCPETSVRNYHYPLSNDPEERSFYLVTKFTFLTLYLSGEDGSGYLSRTAVFLCYCVVDC